ncbi:MAG: D-tyrosyl-tRNA(Tyr) deacylase [Ruminococcaceae bacterium]|jgi:D-tyrosyl-tRNA(Tyr) deacylase|nr:D-tyrosyl-tRNA(Tyr) deacylase [Oscillospiraceae bacterium]
MRAVLSKVKSACVRVDGNVVGEIGEGFLILLGVTHEDTETQCRKLADKLCSLRIFDDENDKINLSLDDVGGEILVVSQFTLYGNCRKGRRPEFLSAARPELAIPLYEKFIELCREKGYRVATGEFGAHMEVESVNNGPFTLIVDTDDLK